jgi:hypothetical protein
MRIYPLLFHPVKDFSAYRPDRSLVSFLTSSSRPYSPMPSGAVHPNTTNFSRSLRLNVVERVRKLVAQGAYESRPEWLQFVERAPPMELENLSLRDIRIKNPYPSMVQFVLKKYPDMRFQDCFVDGNDWSKGNDRYRDDHPVMQFVARQLQLMNTENLSKKDAFERTRQEFLERRKTLETRQKLEMAIAYNQRMVPAFTSPSHPNPVYTTGAAIAHQREAQLEVEHLNHIRRKLRMLRKEIEPHDKRRMNAKEMALDMELERSTILPRMPPSKYAPLKQTVVESTQPPAVEPPVSYFHEEDSFDEDEVETVKSEELWDDIVDEPQPASALPLLKSEASIFQKPAPILKQEPSREIFRSEAPTRPQWAQARPDKISLQTIMARKKKDELQKKIGKEPGETDNLDFEDFMNLVRKKGVK